MTQATQSASLAIKLAPDTKISEYLAKCPEESFNVEHQRKLKDFTLSLAEENLITAMSVDGNSAWSQLYTSISSTMSCDVGGQNMGVAQAASLLASPSSEERLNAWNGIQKAWTSNEEAAAAILNSISGWRLELNRRRAAAAGKPVHFLDTALHQNRMSKKSLDAMMQAVDEGRAVGQRALKLQARVLGKKQLHPSDLMAPPPSAGGGLEVSLQFSTILFCPPLPPWHFF
jgi:oligoendopeptidase F